MALSGSSQEIFRALPRIPLLTCPTPIETCDRLKAVLPSAPNLFIKRDDFSTYLVGGNKVRKLEFTMARALGLGATAVITVGSFQSNHARITAMVARRLGLKCHLVLNGNGEDKPSGNFLISKMLGVDVIPVGTREDRIPMMDEVGRRLGVLGERIYKIPLGASDEVGSFGLTAGLAEVLDQEKSLGLTFNAILFSSSSGGTQAGLEVGKRFFGREDLRIIGVSPDDPAPGIKAVITDIAHRMLSELGIKDSLRADDIEVDDGYFGDGYGLPTEGSEEATQLFARTEGILLDPVYTSKAGAALIDYCRKGLFKRTDNVLFWHTGGLIGLFQ